MTILRYTATIAARVPQQNAPPTFTEIGRLNGAFGLATKETLNRPTELQISFVPTNQNDAVRQWLRSSSYEVWLWREGTLVFAGPAVTRQAQLSDAGIVMSLQCRDRLVYLARRVLDPKENRVYVDADQTLIAKDLIDTVQADDWSDYGIDTSGVSASGVLRDRSYEAGKVHRVGQRVEELAAVKNGFDFAYDPVTGSFDTYYPQRGVDRTSTVILDRSNMIDPGATWSYGIEDIATHAYAISASTSAVLLGEAENPSILATFGRADMAATFSGVTQQQTIDDHATRLVEERVAPLYVPAPQVLLVGFEIEDFEIGDTVVVSYDYGLGLEDTAARIVTRQTKIADDGNLTFGVELV